MASQFIWLVLRQVPGEVAPRFGEYRAHAVEEPVDLGACTEEDAAKDEAGRAVGMGETVGQRECAAPGAAEQQPGGDAEMRPELLHVSHERCGRVVLQLAERHRAAAAALVEHHDAIELRVEETAVDRGRAGAGPAVQEDDGHAFRIAALLPVDRVPAIDRQHPAGIGRDLGKQIGAKRGFRTRHAIVLWHHCHSDASHASLAMPALR